MFIVLSIHLIKYSDGLQNLEMENIPAAIVAPIVNFSNKIYAD